MPGTIHLYLGQEAVNIGAIWDLPVVYICENNLYGASTYISKVMKVEHVSDRASAYGIPGDVDIQEQMGIFTVIRAKKKNGLQKIRYK